jgi:molecular chaperone HtpG
VAQADIEEPVKAEEKGETEKIPDDEFNALIDRFKEVLGERVEDVRGSKRLSQSLVRLVDPDGSLNPELQRVYKFLGKEYEIPKKILELNPSHTVLKKLVGEESNLQTMIIEQIYNSALLVEGLHPNPSSMVPNIQQIIEAALSYSSIADKPSKKAKK